MKRFPALTSPKRRSGVPAASQGARRNASKKAKEASASDTIEVNDETLPAAADADADNAEQSASAEDGALHMSLRGHLTELRSRVLRCVVSILVGFVAMFYFAPFMRGIMTLNLKKAMPPGGEVVFVDVAEPFVVDMQIALVAGFFVAAPYIFYQIWAFIAPGLYDSERKYVVPMALFSALFFISGGVFCYLVVIPFTYSFFIGYGADSSQMLTTISKFFSIELPADTAAASPKISLANMFRFTLRLVLAFGVMFEMPLFSFILSRLGIVTAARLRAWRKYAVLACFIIAALITPPEVYSQLLLAGPMILLYEASILVAATAPSSKNSADKKTTS